MTARRDCPRGATPGVECTHWTTRKRGHILAYPQLVPSGIFFIIGVGRLLPTAETAGEKAVASRSGGASLRDSTKIA